MPFSNYRLPLRPGSTHAKTDLPRKSQRRRTAKPPAPSARSAPARLPPAFVYPETPSSLLLPITVELFPGDHPVAVTASPPSPIPEYDAAIRRLDACVAEATLTTHQKVLLDAAMNTAAHCFGRPRMVHSLIHTIALPSTTVSEILDLVTVVGAGMRAFIAQSGSSTSSSGSNVSSSLSL
ncbi:hypothetical protein Q9L58_005578 [Maublancomyces gigas]|uniref:Uncharacterized protein n=1 Tax=Discina gigas TaxID=1032678 RepID=A0ABR3GHQ5_9PEZI